MLTALDPGALTTRRFTAASSASRHDHDDVPTMLIRMLPRLRRLAYVLTGDLDRGDDLVQRACVRVSSMNHSDSNEPGDGLDVIRAMKDVWLEELAGRCEDAGLRAAQRGKPTAGDCAQNRSMTEVAAAAIMALPTAQRLPVALVCVSGLKYQEAADVLNIPVSRLLNDLLAGRRTIHRAMTDMTA